MTDLDRYDRLKELGNRFTCGVSLLEVIHDAMAVSPYSADAFVPAIYAAREYFEHVTQALEQLRDEESPDGSACR